jgi:hypothetical protein
MGSNRNLRKSELKRRRHRREKRIKALIHENIEKARDKK